MGPCIGKGIHSVIDVHQALMPSDVSGVSSVALGMLIFYDHTVPYLKLGRNIHLHAVRTPCSAGFHVLGSYSLVTLYPGKPSLRVLEFLFTDEPIFHELNLQSV
jgi:hypothetical protein